jgi:hypothetical protein
MGAIMKPATFWEGIAIALIASVVGSIGFFALSFLFSNGLSLRLLTSALTLAYILYLFSRSQEKVGRVSALLIWLVLSTALWLLHPAIGLFLLPHVASIWLIRSLYFYNSLISSLADLGLNALSMASAFWAYFHTGSLFMAIWRFFLMQALFVFIPRHKGRLENKSEVLGSATDFNNAYKTADAAVRKLSSLH